VVADVVVIPYQLVIAPCAGRFLPSRLLQPAGDKIWLDQEQVVGEIKCGTATVPVLCRHPGQLMGMLVLPGQPVHKGDALLWVRGADEPPAAAPDSVAPHD
jgi:hypothetical protein